MPGSVGNTRQKMDVIISLVVAWTFFRYNMEKEPGESTAGAASSSIPVF